MINCQSTTFSLLPPFLLLPLLLLSLQSIAPAHCLTNDGLLLLSFKSSVLADPLSVLADWNIYDSTPCSWNGVICMGFPIAEQQQQQMLITTSSVISLVLPSSRLSGSIPAELGLIEHLRHLDLSGNELNGSIPSSLFNASELHTLALADNELTGELPDFYSNLSRLQQLDLSSNALTGHLPKNLTLLPNLISLSLAENNISGELPRHGFEGLEFLDLSSNLFDGSIPGDLVGGQKLKHLNLSYNRLSGKIPAELGSRVAGNAIVDFSFNNLTGEIPKDWPTSSLTLTAFQGNSQLCGEPLSLCAVPSSLSNNLPLEAKSPPAFAAIPKDSNRTSTAKGHSGSSGSNGGGSDSSSLRPAAIIAIAVGDMAGVGVLVGLFLYVYHVKRMKDQEQMQKQKQVVRKNDLREPMDSPEWTKPDVFSCCLSSTRGKNDDTEDNSESSETEAEKGELKNVAGNEETINKSNSQQKKQQDSSATLVTVDGESDFEVETLLKASAYILGAAGPSILYKAVLADGTALAVRRIGESSAIDKLKDFEAQVRGIAKFRHLNLLRLRGFYWAPDEKLLIHDYAPNGSLGNISFSKKFGAPSLHLSWETRLRIVRGVSRGLAYLHEKKSVHGNLKPNNILLDADMEPKIGDFGLDKLISSNNTNSMLGVSGKKYGSKRTMHTSISLPDLSPVTAGISPFGSASNVALAHANPYQAPESMNNLKPNAKWDVYSFGVILLELVSGRVFSQIELCQWNSGLVVEERNRILRMSDPAIRGEIEGKEEEVLSCFRLGFACCAAAPQRRLAMKEVMQLLEKITASSSSSCS